MYYILKPLSVVGKDFTNLQILKGFVTVKLGILCLLKREFEIGWQQESTFNIGSLFYCMYKNSNVYLTDHCPIEFIMSFCNSSNHFCSRKY